MKGANVLLPTPSVVRATEADLRVVLGWLEAEHRRDRGSGFWVNRRIIAEAQEVGRLWVVRQDDEAVAFHVCDHVCEIVSVRQDCQRHGLGKILVEAWVARAYQNDVNVLVGECSPTTSLPFWLARGFERYGDVGEGRPVLVRRVLPRRHDLPAGRPLVEVVIGFYPEVVTYGQVAALPRPIAEHRLRGAVLDDGAILLERRVIGLRDDEPERKDLAVRIEVAGAERCLGKAKHPAAVALGVRYGGDDVSFHIDRIEPTVG